MPIPDIIKMTNLQTLLIALLIFSTTLLFEYNTNIAKADSPPVLFQQFINGPLLGISQNANGKVDWLIFGNWESSLLSNIKNQNSNVFNATIEMIKPDGTGRHTNSLTNFTILNISYPNNNTIMYNGVSTVTMNERPILNVPTTLLLSNNNVISIMFDPNSVQHHFGEAPFYGIMANSIGPMNGQVNGLQNGSIGGLLHGTINGLTNGISHGPMKGIITEIQNGSIGGLTNGISHGPMKGIINEIQNGSIGGLLQGLLH
jgi:hypothetical protein